MAGEAILTCTAPTQNTDGSALTDLASFRYYYGESAGGPYPNQIDDPDLICGMTVTGLAPGTWYFVSTAINVEDRESAYSNEASKVIPPLVPDPPSGLAVQESNLTAYGISQTNNRLVMYPVGQVPPGTICDGSMSANGLYLVPVEAVQWAGSVRPVVVLAECSGG